VDATDSLAARNGHWGRPATQIRTMQNKYSMPIYIEYSRESHNPNAIINRELQLSLRSFSKL